MWGHDFRPQYRKLSILRDALPGIPIRTYTATPTPRVRRDIAGHLQLDRPEILVGGFDRPNLMASTAGGPRRINIILNWTEELKQRVPVK